MTAKKTHEELVELLQAGKIGFLRFVMDGENAEDYLEWFAVLFIKRICITLSMN